MIVEAEAGPPRGPGQLGMGAQPGVDELEPLHRLRAVLAPSEVLLQPSAMADADLVADQWSQVGQGASALAIETGEAAVGQGVLREVRGAEGAPGAVPAHCDGVRRGAVSVGGVVEALVVDRRAPEHHLDLGGQVESAVRSTSVSTIEVDSQLALPTLTDRASTASRVRRDAVRQWRLRMLAIT